MRKAVGFYWTLPVPWAGFRNLPDGVEEAARVSKTIRYQMHLIRRFAEKERFELIAQRAFIELEPDRPSLHIHEPLRGLAELCRANNAVLLFADFSKVQGWRSHLTMKRWLGGEGGDVEQLPIWPDSVSIDGLDFDPHSHFGEWRDRWGRWMASKVGRQQSLVGEIDKLRETKATYAEIAADLNDRSIQTLTGKEWTGESIRKFVARYRT